MNVYEILNCNGRGEFWFLKIWIYITPWHLYKRVLFNGKMQWLKDDLWKMFSSRDMSKTSHCFRIFQNFDREINSPKGGNRFPELKIWFWQVEIDFLKRGNWFPKLKNEFWQLEIDFLERGNRFPELNFEKLFRKNSITAKASET